MVVIRPKPAGTIQIAVDPAAPTGTVVEEATTMSITSSGSSVFMQCKVCFASFSHLNLHTRIGSIASFPFLGFLCMAAVLLVQSVDNQIVLGSLESQVESLNTVLDLVHELQKEAGAVSIFVSSKGALFKTELLAQRALCDTRITALDQITDRTVLEDPDFTQATKYLAGLIQHRQAVLLFQLATEEEASGYYIQCTKYFTTALRNIGLQSNNANTKRFFTSLEVLSYAKESAGQERASGAAACALDGFATPADYQNFVSLIATWDGFYRLAITYVSSAQLPAIEAIMQAPAIRRAFVMQTQLLTNDPAVITGVDPLEWYWNMTEVIDGLKQVENLISKENTASLQADNSKAFADLLLLLGVLALAIVVSFVLCVCLGRSLKSASRLLDKESKFTRTAEKSMQRFVPKRMLHLLEYDRRLQEAGWCGQTGLFACSQVLGSAGLIWLIESVLQVRLGDRQIRSSNLLVMDIRNFTAHSEGMTELDTFDWLSHFLQIISPVISDNSGFVEKYVGDGLLALFESPQSALNASLQMQVEVAQFNALNDAFGKECVRIGVALHSGAICAGVLGNHERLELTIISISVNVAFRMEAINPVYGSQIVCSDVFCEEVDMAGVGHRYLGQVQVKGATHVFGIFELFQADGLLLRRWKEKSKLEFETAVQHIENRRFAEAVKSLTELDRRMTANDPPLVDAGIRQKLALAKSYHEQGVPGDWVGQHIFTAK
eukprot:NODE_316_length_2420_cov_60.280419_g294_i0.p1 GENE.NODE_316_length_2420_cov_60.280419_g294_i0~~NODE_316_length_2420_cov_60.280419_g294_i0.p1  ORF type:complete len:737 (-),score=222.94 NODE_316_length_2420_cov_60.280419_g294_i0:210-2372(-)